MHYFLQGCQILGVYVNILEVKHENVRRGERERRKEKSEEGGREGAKRREW